MLKYLKSGDVSGMIKTIFFLTKYRKLFIYASFLLPNILNLPFAFIARPLLQITMIILTSLFTILIDIHQMSLRLISYHIAKALTSTKCHFFTKSELIVFVPFNNRNEKREAAPLTTSHSLIRLFIFFSFYGLELANTDNAPNLFS